MRRTQAAFIVRLGDCRPSYRSGLEVRVWHVQQRVAVLKAFAYGVLAHLLLGVGQYTRVLLDASVLIRVKFPRQKMQPTKPTKYLFKE